jgi:DNA-binding transcriptional regulator LsrR (DeoR family)
MTVSLGNVDAKQVLRICELFFADTKAQEIADLVNAEFKLRQPNDWNRQNVYAALALAKQNGWVEFRPPGDRDLEERLAKRFKLKPKTVHVVATPRPEDNELVACSAARIALERIRKLHEEGLETVGLGLGVGRACLDFARHLSSLIRTAHDRASIRLTLHAISAGCPAEKPNYSPTSFFNLFDRPTVVKAVGLFCQTMCRVGEFERVTEQSGFKEAMRNRDAINIVVNSMGCPDDPHDLLSQSLIQEGESVTEWKTRLAVAGNVQYRPFTAKGPVKEGVKELRAVTLFELDDFATWSKQEDKCLILISRQCGVCKGEGTRARAKALYPLLTQPSLRVFKELVVDEMIAAEALKLKA